jgi:16S rRNA processing protein RimM
VGKVTRPHGWGGILRIWPYGGSEASFQHAGRVYLKPESGELIEFSVISIRPHKNLFLMKLAGLNDRAGAEAYRGAEIYVSKENLKREADEYFWHELLGLDVFLENGDHLGHLSQIIPTGSNDIYVVQAGEKAHMVPAIHDVIREIDLKGRRIVIKPLEGLLDLNEI